MAAALRYRRQHQHGGVVPGLRENCTYPRLMSDGGEGAAAAPGLAPDSGLRRGRLLYTLDVEGEDFTVRSHDGGTDYDWVSGPNEDYGFGTGARNMSEAEHRADIRNFLTMIDPATGYISED